MVQELDMQIWAATHYATKYGIQDGGSILTSPIERDSKTLLYEFLLEKIPLLIDEASGEEMMETRLTLGYGLCVDIAVLNGTVTLTTWGGIRGSDGKPERYPPEPTA
jgi:hypothetical protein